MHRLEACAIFSKLPEETDRGGHELNLILQKGYEIDYITY